MVRSASAALRGTAATVLLVLVAAGCDSGSAEPRGAGPEVVATTSILGDVLGSLVGDEGTVEVLMDPGTDPHTFAPSARQAAAIRRADLVVANGLGLEATLADTLAAAEDDGANVLYVADHLDPISRPDGSPDPHVWFDPLRMARAVELIVGELEAIAPGVDWAARGAAYAERLRALDGEVAEILDAVPHDRRHLVTNHDTLGYLAARYGFTVVGTVLPGGGQAAADPAVIAELADALDRLGVPAVFAEGTGTTRLAEALAAESGHDVAVVTLFTDALGPSGSGAQTYPDLLRTDARRIAEALG